MNDDGPRKPRSPRRTRLVGALAAAVALVGLGVTAVNTLPGWGGLFEQHTVDHSPSPLLAALEDVAQYRAATGTFQTLVDLERDTPNVPALVSGERITFFAVGHVDATVDFSALGSDRVAVAPDRRSVAITLPAPALGHAVLDPEQSRVVGRERGLVERVEAMFDDMPTHDQELYTIAGDKIGEAARQSDLAGRAEQNTRDMLTTLAQSFGFDEVTVTFDPPDPR